MRANVRLDFAYVVLLLKQDNHYVGRSTKRG